MSIKPNEAVESGIDGPRLLNPDGTLFVILHHNNLPHLLRTWLGKWIQQETPVAPNPTGIMYDKAYDKIDAEQKGLQKLLQDATEHDEVWIATPLSPKPIEGKVLSIPLEDVGYTHDPNFNIKLKRPIVRDKNGTIYRDICFFDKKPAPEVLVPVCWARVNFMDQYEKLEENIRHIDNIRIMNNRVSQILTSIICRNCGVVPIRISFPRFDFTVGGSATVIKFKAPEMTISDVARILDLIKNCTGLKWGATQEPELYDFPEYKIICDNCKEYVTAFGSNTKFLVATPDESKAFAYMAEIRDGEVIVNHLNGQSIIYLQVDNNEYVLTKGGRCVKLKFTSVGGELIAKIRNLFQYKTIAKLSPGSLEYDLLNIFFNHH